MPITNYRLQYNVSIEERKCRLQEALNGVELIEIYKMNQSKKILFCTYKQTTLSMSIVEDCHM